MLALDFLSFSRFFKQDFFFVVLLQRVRGYSPLKKRERKLRFYVYKISATPLFRCSSRAPFRAHTHTSGPKSIHNGIGAVNATGPPSGSSLHCSGLLVKVHIKMCVHMSNFFAAVENELLLHKTHATLSGCSFRLAAAAAAAEFDAPASHENWVNAQNLFVSHKKST